MASINEIKGRIKEAAGTLTGDKSLKHDGQADQAAGKAKEAVDSIRKRAGEVAESVQNRDHKD